MGPLACLGRWSGKGWRVSMSAYAWMILFEIAALCFDFMGQTLPIVLWIIGNLMRMEWLFTGVPHCCLDFDTWRTERLKQPCDQRLQVFGYRSWGLVLSRSRMVMVVTQIGTIGGSSPPYACSMKRSSEQSGGFFLSCGRR